MSTSKTPAKPFPVEQIDSEFSTEGWSEHSTTFDEESKKTICYQDLVSKGPVETAGLTSTEWKRRLWHMAPGFLPFILWFIPHPDPVSIEILLFRTFLVVGLSVLYLARFHIIARNGEKSPYSAVIGYGSSVLLAFYLFPAQNELGMAVLAILAFGDGSATIGGLFLKGPRLPWNFEKRWSGLLSFLLVGSFLSALVYWGEAQPRVPFSISLICGASATLVACVVESLPSRINDNVRVGYSALIAIAVVHGLVVGW